MKYGKNALLSLTMLLFRSCSKSDDSTPQNSCYDCTLEILGIIANTEYCDNGDVTLEVTSDNSSETLSLDGASFEEFMSGVKLISSCTKISN